MLTCLFNQNVNILVRRLKRKKVEVCWWKGSAGEDEIFNKVNKLYLKLIYQEISLRNIIYIYRGSSRGEKKYELKVVESGAWGRVGRVWERPQLSSKKHLVYMSS